PSPTLTSFTDWLALLFDRTSRCSPSCQAMSVLDRLRALRAPDPLYLADLGSRLSALSAFLGGHAELSALARELEAVEQPGADAEALRLRAIEVLTALTGTASAPAEARRPFWKRT
ncbi:hypothetical protein ABZ297_32040, partial [Nonomuraea sp. NPDC005983]